MPVDRDIRARGDIEEQAREQTGKRQVQLRIDEREVRTSCANAYRTNATAEEVVLDFGFNTVTQQRQQPIIAFKVSDRIIVNHYSAKRLAATLSQLIRRHESQFGELELNVDKRERNRRPKVVDIARAHTVEVAAYAETIDGYQPQVMES